MLSMLSMDDLPPRAFLLSGLDGNSNPIDGLRKRAADHFVGPDVLLVMPGPDGPYGPVRRFIAGNPPWRVPVSWREAVEVAWRILGAHVGVDIKPGGNDGNYFEEDELTEEEAPEQPNDALKLKFMHSGVHSVRDEIHELSSGGQHIYDFWSALGRLVRSVNGVAEYQCPPFARLAPQAMGPTIDVSLASNDTPADLIARPPSGVAIGYDKLTLKGSKALFELRSRAGL